jgi:hypothetical protein
MRDDIGGARAASRNAVATLAMIDGQEVRLAQARFDLAELDRAQWSAAGIKRLFSTQRTTQKWSPIDSQSPLIGELPWNSGELGSAADVRMWWQQRNPGTPRQRRRAA